MGLPDNQLDAWIESALQSGTTLSSHRKQLALEQIIQQARHQTALPPMLATAESQSIFRRVIAYSCEFWQWMATFAVDESQYERARQCRHLIRYSPSVANGRMPTQMIEPLRFNFMSPVF